MRSVSPYLFMVFVHYAYLLILVVPILPCTLASMEGLLLTIDEVIVCRSDRRLSDRFGDVDIPSHVVAFERGSVKRDRWLRFPVLNPLCNSTRWT